MSLYEQTKSAYQEIINTINKYSYLCNIDVKDVEFKMENHLFGIELFEKYGINVNPKYIYKTCWNNISRNISIGYYPKQIEGKNTARISWSDDGMQPSDEYLVAISFSSGAYIFGECYEYQEDAFSAMFEEFRSYKPKYSDTHNHSLYFTLDNAAEPFNRFNEIVAKYRDLAKEEIRIKKAAALQKQLDELKGE